MDQSRGLEKDISGSKKRAARRELRRLRRSPRSRSQRLRSLRKLRRELGAFVLTLLATVRNVASGLKKLEVEKTCRGRKQDGPQLAALEKLSRSKERPTSFVRSVRSFARLFFSFNCLLALVSQNSRHSFFFTLSIFESACRQHLLSSKNI